MSSSHATLGLFYHRNLQFALVGCAVRFRTESQNGFGGKCVDVATRHSAAFTDRLVRSRRIAKMPDNI